eukprot:TRINITY_DN16060_c0_g1_i2.p2 TRINITY_DN16060_c0_g1~~TRINITY_DN16060_c0_g1_i2.p2  ORF type:complete len:197 (-),score=29.82 TRINITY_DN16060_c0_g1_i2:28-618(-)
MPSAFLEALASQAFGDEVPGAAGEEPEAYLRLCRSYQCALWTLLHVLTLAAAEKAKSSGSGTVFLAFSSGPSPEDTLKAIRHFVERLSGCKDCQGRFLAAYDACLFGRCKLQPQDGPGAAVWLWQSHNDVAGRAPGSDAESRPSATWPSAEACPECWITADGERSWKAGAVYEHLRRNYWHPDWVPGGLDEDAPDL